MTNYFIIRAASCCKEIFIKFPLSITSVKFKSFSFLQYSKKPPLEEMNMPFYYLGVSIANEVLTQNSLKSILNHDEMGYLIQGFSNTLLGTKCLDISYSELSYDRKIPMIAIEYSTDRFCLRECLLYKALQTMVKKSKKLLKKDQQHYLIALK